MMRGKPPAGKILIKDAITGRVPAADPDAADEFDVIPACNLTATCSPTRWPRRSAGIGIAPGANINYDTGHALFEHHGTAPKYAGQDKVNPGSVILSGRDDVPLHGWTDAPTGSSPSMSRAKS